MYYKTVFETVHKCKILCFKMCCLRFVLKYETHIKFCDKFNCVTHFKTYSLTFFYVLLTVHLSIFILVINQLMQKSCFKISLFHASTCFEHYVLIVRRSKLYYTASGIITPIGSRPVHMCTGRPPIGVMIPEAV